MAVLNTTQKGFLWRLFHWGKPVKPNARGNAVAYKVGARSFKAKNGSTPGLQHVVRMSLQNEARLKK